MMPTGRRARQLKLRNIVWVSSIGTQARLLTRSKAPCGVCVQNGKRKLQRSNRSGPFRLADRRKNRVVIRVGHMVFRRPIAHRPAQQADGPLPILKLRQRCASVRNTVEHPMSWSEATFRNIQLALRTRHSAGKSKVWCGAWRVVPTPEVERRQPVQYADLGRDTRQRARCADSRPSRPRPGAKPVLHHTVRISIALRLHSGLMRGLIRI